MNPRVLVPDKPRVRSLTPVQEARVLAYSKAGHTCRAIARVMRCSEDFIQRVLKRARGAG